MIHPRRTKYRKTFAVSRQINRKELKEIVPRFGSFGLKVEESCILSETQIEALRKTVRKILKKRGKIWLGVFANVSFTSKPAEVRMGRGKGVHEFWGSCVDKGRVIIEVRKLKRKVRNGLLRRALLLGGSKLPVKTSLIKYSV